MRCRLFFYYLCDGADRFFCRGADDDRVRIDFFDDSCDFLTVAIDCRDRVANN